MLSIKQKKVLQATYRTSLLATHFSMLSELSKCFKNLFHPDLTHGFEHYQYLHSDLNRLCLRF